MIKYINKFFSFIYAFFLMSTPMQAKECPKVDFSKLPKGDYICNSKTGELEPFLPGQDRHVTDFVSGCENTPTLEKNIQHLGQLISTAIMGKDNRCPFIINENHNLKDKSLYGVGELFDYSRECVGKSGNPCGGTAHLVMDQDIVITSAHTFFDQNNGKYNDGKGFKFSIKVWIPKELRKNINEAYEYRSYEVESVEFGSGSLSRSVAISKDWAFVKLKKPVSSSVGKKIKNMETQIVNVDKEHWIKPLPFKILGDIVFSKKGQMIALQEDKEGFYKNCEFFRLYKDPNSAINQEFSNLILHDGDMVGESSGAAIVIEDQNDNWTFAGINIKEQMLESHNNRSGNFDIENRINIAISGDSFYQDFMNFRKKYGRN